MVKRLLIVTQIVNLLFLTGCWDRIEIEQRAFVYGMAIDLKEKKTDNNYVVNLTQQLIVPSALISAQGGGGELAFRNLSQSGETIIDINREMLKQASRKINVTHLRVVIFSEDIAKEPTLLRQLMDVFLREKEMRRGIKVIIGSGNAKDLLGIKPEHEKVPTEYIENLLSIKGNLGMIEPVRAGEIQEYLLSKRSFILPKLKMLNSKSSDYEGLSVFHGPKSRIVGTLTGDESKGLSLIRGEKQSGTINVEIDGKTAAIEILEINSGISLNNKDKNNLKFRVNIDVNAAIGEQFGSVNLLKARDQKRFEKKLEEKIEEITKKTIDTLQSDLQADVLGLDQHLNQFNYKLWESIKDNWDNGENYFSKSEIDVTINAKIGKGGNVNQTY